MLMGIYRSIVKLVNRNVFLSNFLLLPAIYYCAMGIHNINGWGLEETRELSIWRGFWIFMLILIILVFIFSMLYHGVMFRKNGRFIKLISKIDYLVTAPLMAFSCIFLFVNYIIYNYLRDGMGCNVFQISNEVFGMAALYLIFTFFYYIIKSNLHRGYKQKNVIKKVIFLVGHTLFHYIGHTGITLLILVYLLENKNMFNTYFLKKC